MHPPGNPQRADTQVGPYPVKRDFSAAPKGSPSGGAGTAQAVTERALSAPSGGTSPIGGGKVLPSPLWGEGGTAAGGDG